MIVAPSLLAFNMLSLKRDLSIVKENTDYLHFDVMDGHFVPNLSFGPQILKDLSAEFDFVYDVHLMLSKPDQYLEAFYKVGASIITIHYEAYNDIDSLKKVLNDIKKLGIKCGISISPDTKVEVLYDLVDCVDLVLVMSVYPGFGGQSFIESSYEKITSLANYRSDHKLNYLIEVDGGVNDKNAEALKKAGADILVAGSYVTKGDIKANINKMVV